LDDHRQAGSSGRSQGVRQEDATLRARCGMGLVDGRIHLPRPQLREGQDSDQESAYGGVFPSGSGVAVTQC